MSGKDRITGVLSPVVTPFKPDLTPDPSGSRASAAGCLEASAWRFSEPTRRPLASTDEKVEMRTAVGRAWARADERARALRMTDSVR